MKSINELPKGVLYQIWDMVDYDGKKAYETFPRVSLQWRDRFMQRDSGYMRRMRFFQEKQELPIIALYSEELKKFIIKISALNKDELKMRFRVLVKMFDDALASKNLSSKNSPEREQINNLIELISNRLSTVPCTFRKKFTRIYLLCSLLTYIGKLLGENDRKLKMLSSFEAKANKLFHLLHSLKLITVKWFYLDFIRWEYLFGLFFFDYFCAFIGFIILAAIHSPLIFNPNYAISCVILIIVTPLLLPVVLMLLIELSNKLYLGLSIVVQNLKEHITTRQMHHALSSLTPFTPIHDETTKARRASLRA